MILQNKIFSNTFLSEQFVLPCCCKETPEPVSPELRMINMEVTTITHTCQTVDQERESFYINSIGQTVDQ